MSDARRIVATYWIGSRRRSVIRSANSPTRREWPAEYGDFRSAKSAKASATSSSCASRRKRCGESGSRPNTVSHTRLLLQAFPEARLTGNVLKRGHDRWVECGPLPASSQTQSRISAAEAMQRLEETGRMHNSRRDRYQLTAASSRATAVPLFDHRQERSLHSIRHVESLRETLCHLAGVLETFAHELTAVQCEVQTALKTRGKGLSRRDVIDQPAERGERVSGVAVVEELAA